MGKGDRQKGNREVKKPKKEVVKVPLAAASTNSRADLVVGGKKVK